MFEMRCKQCGKEFSSKRDYEYCPPCRYSFGIANRNQDNFWPSKGRDKLSERLRDGYELMSKDGDDNEEE